MHEILNWYPPVGFFIGILAVLGVLVPLLRDTTKIERREKAVWTAVMFLLVGLEIRTLYLDRADHDQKEEAARKLQLQGFKEIGDGIKSAIQESQEQFAATMKSQKQTLNWISGGDAYTGVMVDLRTMQLEVSTGGPQPLRDVYLNVFDTTHASENPRQVYETARVVPVGIVYPTVLRHLDFQLPVAGDSASFMIRIYQTNGSFTEYLNLLKQGNSWTVKNTELYRDKDKKRLVP